ncbi:hypothetical protein SISSUDRAFT_1001203, partial [Sistotremastrum suecicum HHB10207 ss-3]
MFGLENRKTRTRRTHHTNNPLTTTSSSRNRKWYQRKNPNRRAGGLKAALHNPNTTSHGRKNAKHELRAMVSLSTRDRRQIQSSIDRFCNRYQRQSSTRTHAEIQGDSLRPQ